MPRIKSSSHSSNPGLGRKFYFFGKFKSLILARRSEKEHPHSFIVKRRGYYYVVKEKPKKNPRRGRQLLFRKTIPNERTRQAFIKRMKRQGLWPSSIGNRVYVYDHPLTRFQTMKPNPRHVGTLIYGRVLKIFAQKTSGRYKGQRFVHSFKRGAQMYGMPDGSLRIIHS